MKITLQGSAGGQPVTLAGNETRENPNNMTINGRSNVQIAEYSRGQEPEFFDRKNFKTQIGFEVTRLFATGDAAQSFMLKHAADLASSPVGVVTFICADGTRRQLKKAAVMTVESRHKGVSTFHKYEINGGLMT